MEIIACQSYKTERIYPSRTFCLDIIIFAYFSIIIFSIIIFFIQEGRFKADFPQYPLLTIYLWKILHYKYYVIFSRKETYLGKYSIKKGEKSKEKWRKTTKRKSMG